MALHFHFESLRDKALEFRPFLGDDHVAEVGGLRCGWILSGGPPGSGSRWWWTMTGPCCATGRINNVGSAHTLEEAKSEFQDAYRSWLAWAALQSGPLSWWGSPPADRAALELLRPD